MIRTCLYSEKFEQDRTSQPLPFLGGQAASFDSLFMVHLNFRKAKYMEKKHIYFRSMGKQASPMLCKMYRIQNILKNNNQSKTIDYNCYYTIFRHYQLCPWLYWVGRCGAVSLPEIWHILSPWPPEGKFIDTHIFHKVTALPLCSWRMIFPLFLSSCQYFTLTRANYNTLLLFSNLF